MFKRTPPPLAILNDKFQDKKSAKVFTIVGYHHATWGGHDVFHLKADDGEERQIASFMLMHKYNKLHEEIILTDRDEKDMAEGRLIITKGTITRNPPEIPGPIPPPPVV